MTQMKSRAHALATAWLQEAAVMSNLATLTDFATLLKSLLPDVRVDYSGASLVLAEKRRFPGYREAIQRRREAQQQMQILVPALRMTKVAIQQLKKGQCVTRSDALAEFMLSRHLGTPPIGLRKPLDGGWRLGNFEASATQFQRGFVAGLLSRASFLFPPLPPSLKGPLPCEYELKAAEARAKNEGLKKQRQALVNKITKAGLLNDNELALLKGMV